MDPAAAGRGFLKPIIPVQPGGNGVANPPLIGSKSLAGGKLHVTAPCAPPAMRYVRMPQHPIAAAADATEAARAAAIERRFDEVILFRVPAGAEATVHVQKIPLSVSAAELMELCRGTGACVYDCRLYCGTTSAPIDANASIPLPPPPPPPPLVTTAPVADVAAVPAIATVLDVGSTPSAPLSPLKPSAAITTVATPPSPDFRVSVKSSPSLSSGAAVASIGLNYAYVSFYSVNEARRAARMLNGFTIHQQNLQAKMSRSIRDLNFNASCAPPALGLQACVDVANHFIGPLAWSCGILATRKVNIDAAMWTIMMQSMTEKRMEVNERLKVKALLATASSAAAAAASIDSKTNSPLKPKQSGGTSSASAASAVAPGSPSKLLPLPSIVVPSTVRARPTPVIPPYCRDAERQAIEEAEEAYQLYLIEWRELHAAVMSGFNRHATLPIAHVAEVEIRLRNGVLARGKGVGHMAIGEDCVEQARKRAVTSAYANAWSRLAIIRIGSQHKTDVRLVG